MSDGRMYAFIRDAVNGDEWAGTGTAVNDLRSIVKLSTLSAYTPSTATTLSGHADITAGVGTTTLSADTVLSSLRFSKAQDTVITQDATSRILDTGGILVSSTVGAHTTTISTNSIRPTASTLNNPELIIVQNNVDGPLVLESRIVNRLDVNRTIVSVAKTGPGLLVLKGANTFTGNLRLYEGAIQFAGGSVSSSIEFLMGYGARSGKIILGDGSTAFNTTVEYVEVSGVGTDNRIVGGASVISTLTLGGTATTLSAFGTGFLGGSGANENNLALTFNRGSAAMTLGAANTYIGKTILRQGTLEAASFADAGQPSSLGRGTSDPVIEMGSITTGTVAAAKLRHVGAVDSVSDRVVNLASSLAGLTSLTATIENDGAGSLQFTSAFTSTGTNVTAARTLVLGGAHTGDNRIVGVGNNGTAGTALQKVGAGTWTLTGDNAYSGGTRVEAGALLVSNLTGSGTGSGDVTVLTGAILGGTGRIAPGAGKSVIVSGGTMQIGADLPGKAAAAGSLTIQTSGGGMLDFQPDSYLHFDLLSGAGMGDNTGLASAADLAIIGGAVNIGARVTLKVSNPTGMSTWAGNDQWKLFDWSGLTGVTGSVQTYDLPDLPAGLMWDTSALFTTGFLSISMVPEPSRLLFLGLGGLILMTRRRRLKL